MLVGIDLGTSSLKAAVLSEKAEVTATETVPYDVDSPRPGWAETQPEEWWRGCIRAVRAATDGCGDVIEAIGFSGQMHGVVLSGRGGEPLRPAILWADNRSTEELKTYEELGDEAREHLANPLVTGMAGPSLLWLRSHEPEHYANARWALQPKDWLRFRLTGEAAADPSDASATLLYDVIEDHWSDEVVGTLRLRRELLPPLLPSAAPTGKLHEDAAAELGLRPGVLVAVGAADTAAAALGTGVVKQGQVQLTVGTGAQIVTPRSEPVLDRALRTHLYRAATPSGWYAMGAVQNAGLALEWARRLLSASWKEFYVEAFSVPPGAEGVTFVPYVTGERTPHMDPGARGAWAGLGLGHGRPHLLRACLEGVAFSLREALEALERTGVEARQMRLAGGGTLRSEWRQMLSDVLDRPLLAVRDEAASARGAALLGGIACGLYSGVDEAAALAPRPAPATRPVAAAAYEEAFTRFRRLYPALREAGSNKIG
jgi:xylulokinase